MSLVVDASDIAHIGSELSRHMEVAKGISPDYRVGQGLFNVLCLLHPKIAEGIRGSKYDMFHTDSKDEAFEKLAGYLKDKEILKI
jgi:hypothetical protein